MVWQQLALCLVDVNQMNGVNAVNSPYISKCDFFNPFIVQHQRSFVELMFIH